MFQRFPSVTLKAERSQRSRSHEGTVCKGRTGQGWQDPPIAATTLSPGVTANFAFRLCTYGMKKP